MKILSAVAVFLSILPIQATAQGKSDQPSTYPSAGIESPPSAEKSRLIARFMHASGLQARLDSGSFLERYAFVPELGWDQGSSDENLLETLFGPVRALKSVYEKYRPIYQEEYESHINWEFTEEELRQMVTFFESSVGQHYLDGTWRLGAYTGTNLEETEQALVTEAVALYRSGAATAEPDTKSDSALP